jgi:DNA-directed RNA polymerase sigma subunit (sigma70/sigma32)
MSGEGSTSDRVTVESNVRCSFCSKRRGEVGLLIGAQPSECFICNECVDLCNEIVEEELELELVEVEPSRRPEHSGARAPTADGHDIEAVWDQFRQGDRIEARPHLIIHYAALVTDAADEIKERLTAAQRSDLVSYGIFGLIDALDEFDPEQGRTFERFATERIREAMLRELLAP